jgi:hypothetical protein
MADYAYGDETETDAIIWGKQMATHTNERLVKDLSGAGRDVQRCATQ